MSSSSLLKNIITEIVNDTGNINSILMKCFYLALKLEDNDFAQWIKNEISGYTYHCKDIPFYRQKIISLKAEFRSVESGKIEILTVDPMELFANEELHGQANELFFPPKVIASVANIQHAIGQGYYHQELLGDANLAYCRRFQKDKLECLRVYQDFSISSLSNIFECIKANILEIVIDLEKKIPDIHEIIAIKSTEKIDNEVKSIVNNIVNNTIHGNANIANASENFNQNIQLQSDELINNLLSELLQLKEQGKDVDTIDTVIPQIEEMKQIKDQKGIMDKLASVMTIAGGSASVCGLVAQYIPAISKLIG